MARPADRKMVAARSVGWGWFWRRKDKTFGFQQGAEGTKPRGRGFDPHRRRWNRIDIGRLLAATAARDRAASRPLSVSGIAFVAQVAAGRSENGGGSKRWFWCGFGEEKREHSDSNKALKVQTPADGVLTLIADVGLTKMKTDKRDIVFFALHAIRLIPFIMCAAIGLIMLPRFIMHADPPMMITRFIRVISDSTGIGTVLLVYVLLIGPGVVSAILFSAFGGNVWIAQRTLERQKKRSQQ